MTRHHRRRQPAQRGTTLIDVLHLAAILCCTAWTAHIIIAERGGSAFSAAQLLTGQPTVPPAQGLTIRLDTPTQTAAR